MKSTFSILAAALCLSLSAEAAMPELPDEAGSLPDQPVFETWQEASVWQQRVGRQQTAEVGDSELESFGVLMVFKSLPDGVAAPQSTSELPAVAGLRKALPRSIELPAPALAQTPDAQARRENLEAVVGRLNNLYHAELQEGVPMKQALQELRATGLFEYVEPNYHVDVFAKPNDPYFDEVWGLHNTGQPFYEYANPPEPGKTGTADADMDWLESWEASELPSDEVVVCVIDTGVAYTHPDIANQMWTNDAEFNGTPGVDDDNNGYVDDIYGIDTLNGDADPWDDHGHGTHCAGTIAAEADNGIGITGVNPHARIMACKFLGANGGSTLGAIECIEYAVDMGADVLSNSWGGGGYSLALQDVITYANEQGVAFVAAAGNSNTIAPSYPAAYKGVVAVVASDCNDERAYFSNYGSHCDVMAPGVDILSLRSPDLAQFIHPVDSTLAVMSGTSMACPAVAGAMSLLVAKYPGLDPALYEGVIKASADDRYAVADINDDGQQNSDYTGRLGTGRINVPAMLNFDGAGNFFDTWTIFPNGVSTFVVPEAYFNLHAEVGAWTQPMENVSVRLVNPDANLKITGETSYDIGTINPFERVQIPDDVFEIQIQADAQWGETVRVTFELLSGTTVLGSRTHVFTLYSTSLSGWKVADLEDDGYKEIIGGYSDIVFVLDNAGQYKNHSQLHNYLVAPFLSYFGHCYVGNFDGNPDNGQEYGMPAGYYTGYTEFQFFRADGTFWKKCGADLFSGTVYDVVVYDVDNDGRDELVFTGTDDGDGMHSIYGVDVLDTVYTNPDEDEEEMTTAVDIRCRARNEDHRHLIPAVDDTDGNGTVELVTVSSRTAYLGASDPAFLEIYDAEDGSLLHTHPIPTEYICGAASSRILLGDVDGNGIKDALFWVKDEFDVWKLMVMDTATGKILDGWPAKLPTDRMEPSLADLDMNGDLEIVLAAVAFDPSMMIRVYNHDATEFEGFPLHDQGLIRTAGIVVTDIDHNDSPDLLYLRMGQWDRVTDEHIYEIMAVDNQGLALHGFPIQVKQEYSSSLDGAANPIAVEVMSPGYDGESGRVTILSEVGFEGVKLSDGGFDLNPGYNQWPKWLHDWSPTSAFVTRVPGLQTRVTADLSEGYGSVEVTFYANVIAFEQDHLVFHWDFDNDGTFDLEGATATSPTHRFTHPGGPGSEQFTVRLVVTNNEGGSYEVILDDFITTYPVSGIDADFTHSVSSGVEPLYVTFTDVSLYGAEAYEWDFDNDGVIDSTEQNPSWEYSTPGVYTVSLRAYNSFGGDATETKTALITVTPDTFFRSSDAAAWNAQNADTPEDVFDIAWSGTQWLAVGANGQYMESTDGVNWSTLGFGTLNDVCYANSQYVAVGVGGLVLTSPDGYTWTMCHAGVAEDLNGIAWDSDNAVYIAVGDGGTILRSADAVNWTADASGVTDNLHAVAVDPVDGGYMAVGDNGCLITADSSVTTWQQRDPETSENLYDCAISSANYALIVGARGTVLVAPRDVTFGYAIWSAKNLGTSRDMLSAKAVGSVFYIAGTHSKGFRSITNGSTWETWTISGSSTVVNDFLWHNDEPVLVCEDGSIHYNQIRGPDTWQLLPGRCHNSKSLNAIAYADSGQYVAVGNGGTLIVSEDRKQWDITHSAAPQAVEWLNDRFYVVGDLGFVGSSADLQTWTFHHIGEDDDVYAIGYNGSQFVIAASENGVYSSVDGETWTKQRADISRIPDIEQAFRAVGWNGTTWLLGGEGGKLITSTDGQTWAPLNCGSTKTLYNLEWAGGQWVATGQSGLVLTSTDGTTWTPHSSNVNYDLYDTVWTGSQLIAGGQNGTILTSTDGERWVTQTLGSTVDVHALGWDGTDYLAVGRLTTRYVALGGTGLPPYRSWDTASPSLQAAQDYARPGDNLLVGAGTYYKDNRSQYTLLEINTDKLTVRSAAGAAQTILDVQHYGRGLEIRAPLWTGHGEKGGVGRVIFDGFTIKNASAQTGAGVWVVNGFNCVIRNCVVTENTQDYALGFLTQGGGIAAGSNSVGAMTLLVEDCEVSNNYAHMSGAGIVKTGIYQEDALIVNRCRIFGNESRTGVSAVDSAIVRNSLIYDNHGGHYTVGTAFPVTNLNDGKRYPTELYNCTVTGNTTITSGEGSPYAATVLAGIVSNSIIKNNTSSQGTWAQYHYFSTSYSVNYADIEINSTCADSLPPVGTLTDGANISVDPLFVDAPNGDFRLSAASPCINAGSAYQEVQYNATRTMLFDLGRPETTSDEPSGVRWNDITTLTAGVAVTDAIDDAGNATGISLTFGRDWDSVLSGALPHDQSEEDPALWVDSAQEDCFLVNTPEGNPMTLYFSGLNPDNVYDLSLMASTASQGYEGYYQVVGSDEEYLPITASNLAYPPRRFHDERPDASDELHFSVSFYSTPNSVLGVLELVEKTPTFFQSPLLVWTDFLGYPRIADATPDMGAYEYHGGLAPVAFAEVLGQPYINQAVTFDASGSTDADSTIVSFGWDWDNDGFVDESGPTLSQPQHTWTEAGWQNVALTVTDTEGLTDTYAFAFEVSGSPQAPSTLSVAANGTGIDLAWADNAHNETGFRIYRQTTPLEPVDVIVDDAQMDDLSVIYEDGDLYEDGEWYLTEWATAESPSAYNGTYHYLDFGDNWGGTPDAPVWVRPQVPEGNYNVYFWFPDNATMPHQMRTDIVDWTEVLFGYFETANNKQQINLNPHTNPGTWALLGNYDLNPSSNFYFSPSNGTEGGVLIDAFRFVKVEPFVEIASVGADATAYTDADVQEGRTYTYKVVAFNDDGRSLDSNTDNVQIPHTNNAPVASIDTVTPTNGVAPLLVSVTGSATDVEDDDAALHYKWNFGDGFTGSIQQGVNRTSAQYTYRYTGDYTISLTVTDSAGFAHTQTFALSIEGAIPNAPSNLTATAKTETAIDLSWTDNSINEDAFEIQRKIDAGPFEALATTGISIRSYADTGLTPGKTYTYRVRAVNAYGVSAWSSEQSVSLEDITPPSLTSVYALDNTTVIALFSEAVTQASAENAANYALSDGLFVTNAVQDTTDASKITLTVDTLSEGGTYTLTVNNIVDINGGNIIAANTQESFSFIAYDHIVTTEADSGAGSLRDILSAAAEGDTIIFANNVETITLTSGEIEITRSMTLNGQGTVTISAGGASRVFSLNGDLDTETFTFQNLTIAEGYLMDDNGAGIHMEKGSLVLENCTFQNHLIEDSDSTINEDGGALYIKQRANAATITNCLFINNQTADDGGALFITDNTDEASVFTITDCTFSGNTAGDTGGAAYVDIEVGGSLDFGNCTLAGNTALDDGGAIYFAPASGTTITMTQCTVSGNTATDQAGGLYFDNATFNIYNSTIYGNTGDPKDGQQLQIQKDAVVNIYSSIIAGGSSDMKSNAFDPGYGLTLDHCVYDATKTNVSTGSGTFTTTACVDLAGAALQINALADNGGTTQTHTLPEGSQAIDAGSNPLSLGTDQRGTGYLRVINGTADIGALEYGAQRSAFENWLGSYPGLTGDAALEMADPDGDGVPNLMEYALNLNPMVVDVNHLPQSAPEENATFVFTYRRNVAATELTYQVQATETLSSGNWIDVASQKMAQIDPQTEMWGATLELADGQTVCVRLIITQ